MPDVEFSTLCRTLAQQAGELDAAGIWPDEQLQLLGKAGVFTWFAPKHLGGVEYSETDLLRVYLELAKACLTTAFILTQRQGAVGRILACENKSLCNSLLPELLSGRTFATVGISHLTTSRRHLAKPAMLATETDEGFVLTGESPWVTGSPHADFVVLGAELNGAELTEGRQILVALPMNLPGVETPPPESLVALAASCTGKVVCRNVFLDRQWLMAGPTPEIMKQSVGGRTGGLQTTALALGLTAAALEFLAEESTARSALVPPAEQLQNDYDQLHSELFALAQGCGTATSEELRSRANSLVLRATQAALAAAKGTGFVTGHPAGRWCREALFFLVWSCPQAVLAANLCEFAGLPS